jgi:fermentation-respiration switch protein FrsA (DUF1100 family)
MHGASMVPNIGLSIATIVLLLYVLFCPRLNYAFYRPMLFHPWKLNKSEPVAPPLSGVTGENVFFPSENGRVLNGWYYKLPGAKYTIIFSHGNGGEISVRSDLVELLLKAHVSVLIYDYGGYGESAGNPSVEAICQDGAGAYKYLTAVRGVKPNEIILYGESLGAAVSSYLSTRFECRALILQSGFTSLYRIACEVFPVLRVYPSFLFPMPPLDTLSILSKPHPPLLLIHGDEDAVVPVQHSKTLYECARAPKKFLELTNTGHSDIYKTAPKVYVKAIEAFMKTLN